MENKPLNERSNDFNNLIFIIQDHQKCIKYVSKKTNVFFVFGYIFPEILTKKYTYIIIIIFFYKLKHLINTAVLGQ